MCASKSGAFDVSCVFLCKTVRSVMRLPIGAHKLCTNHVRCKRQGAVPYAVQISSRKAARAVSSRTRTMTHAYVSNVRKYKRSVWALSGLLVRDVDQFSVQIAPHLITQVDRRLTPNLSLANTLSRGTWNQIKQSDRVTWQIRCLLRTCPPPSDGTDDTCAILRTCLLPSDRTDDTCDVLSEKTSASHQFTTYSFAVRS